MEIFRKELEKKKKELQDGAMNTNDLMDGMMRLKDDEGKQLSDTEVLDNILSLVVGGYESTSLAIMWALYYLPKYPNVLQKLRVRLHDCRFIWSYFFSRLLLFFVLVLFSLCVNQNLNFRRRISPLARTSMGSSQPAMTLLN